MTNATRPDLSDFFKQARHSYNSSRTGTRNVQNATEAQRRFLGVKKDMTTTTIRGNWPAPAETPEPSKPKAAPAKPAAAKPAAKPAAASPAHDDDFVIVDVPFTHHRSLPGASIYQREIDFLIANPDAKAVDCRDDAKAKRLVHAIQRNIDNRKLRDKLRVSQRRIDGVTRVWVLSRA